MGLGDEAEYAGACFLATHIELFSLPYITNS